MKRERRALMDSLAALKADQGKAGSERQMSDIARLRRELESKQEKMNELHQVCRCLTADDGRAQTPWCLHTGSQDHSALHTLQALLRLQPAKCACCPLCKSWPGSSRYTLEYHYIVR